MKHHPFPSVYWVEISAFPKYPAACAIPLRPREGMLQPNASPMGFSQSHLQHLPTSASQRSGIQVCCCSQVTTQWAAARLRVIISSWFSTGRTVWYTKQDQVGSVYPLERACASPSSQRGSSCIAFCVFLQKGNAHHQALRPASVRCRACHGVLASPARNRIWQKFRKSWGLDWEAVINSDSILLSSILSLNCLEPNASVQCISSQSSRG